jgi:glutathione S-transferase
MIKLHYFSLCPFSRVAKFLLGEMGLEHDIQNHKYWERTVELASLNPAFELPVIQDAGFNIADITAVTEYLLEKYKNSLMPNDLAQKAEIRRICSWFNRKFYNEVLKYVLNEKLIRFYKKQGYPNSELLRTAKSNFSIHYDYINFLLSKRKWLAGEKFSVADVTAACHLSVLDYFGEIDWHEDDAVKNWYQIIKSKPSFRKILSEKITSFDPPAHYATLDY